MFTDWYKKNYSGMNNEDTCTTNNTSFKTTNVQGETTNTFR